MADIKVYADSPPPYNAVPVPGYGVTQPGVVNVAIVDDSCIVQQQPCVATPVVILGSVCPACRVGILQEEFTGCGICLGICFFPLGLICCLLMRDRRCNHCRATYS